MMAAAMAAAMAVHESSQAARHVCSCGSRLDHHTRVGADVAVTILPARQRASCSRINHTSSSVGPPFGRNPQARGGWPRHMHTDSKDGGLMVGLLLPAVV